MGNRTINTEQGHWILAKMEKKGSSACGAFLKNTRNK